jgi:hypothetical protein
VKLGEICEWFQCDNQGRGGDDTPIWGCALQGRVCNAVQKGKMSTNVTAAWSTGTPRWRNVYKSPQGDGVVETFAWETQAGFAVHVLNYTNPAMHRGWIRKFYPIGGQKVRMSLPQGRRVTRVELLRAEKNIPFTGGSGSIEFTIPGVLDYEVAALHSA